MKNKQTLFVIGKRSYTGEYQFELSSMDISKYDPSKFVVDTLEVEFEVPVTDNDLIPIHLESIKQFKETAAQDYRETIQYAEELERDLRKLTHDSDYISRDDNMP